MQSIDLRTSVNGEEYSREIQKRINELLDAGFTQEWIDTVRGSVSNTLFTNPQEKIEVLKTLGFTDPVKLITTNPKILSYNIKPKIEVLKTLGFTDPVKLITTNPKILSYNIKPKIEVLKTLGFTDPVKLITSFPAILRYSIEESIKPKIEELRKLGFTDPVKLITSSPQILALSIEENIKPKIEALKSLGFENPVKLISSLPAILSLSIEENIKPKIEVLKTLGFTDPVKLITTNPQILSYSIEENIKPKIRLLDTMIQNITTARTLIYQAPELLGTKKDKSWIILRGLYTLGLLNSDVVSRYKEINLKEIESFVLAVTQLEETENVTLQILLSTIKKIKKDGDKSTRKSRITGNSKTEKRYRRGYP